jgi:hypothetical protein
VIVDVDRIIGAVGQCCGKFNANQVVAGTNCWKPDTVIHYAIDHKRIRGIELDRINDRCCSKSRSDRSADCGHLGVDPESAFLVQKIQVAADK